MRPIAVVLGLVLAAGASPGALPQAAKVVGTLRFSVHETELFTARNGTLFVLVLPESYGHRFTVVRVGGNGRATRELRFSLTPYIWNVVAGPDGLYVGTCVIRRFTSARDQLLRIDPKTLKVQARAFFPGMVTLVARGSRLWATIGNGDVVRLNPRTLAVEARRRVVRHWEAGEQAPLYSVTMGLGSLWVLAYDRTAMTLLRIDPVSLAIRSQTRLRRGLAATVDQVVAGPRGVFLLGYAIAAVDARGRIGRTIPEPDLGAAAVYGSGLVGVTPGGVELLDARGRVRARTRLRDAGNPLALVGRDLWLLGNAGRGNGIVHVRLAAAPPSS